MKLFASGCMLQDFKIKTQNLLIFFYNDDIIYDNENKNAKHDFI